MSNDDRLNVHALLHRSNLLRAAVAQVIRAAVLKALGALPPCKAAGFARAHEARAPTLCFLRSSPRRRARGLGDGGAGTCCFSGRLCFCAPNARRASQSAAWLAPEGETSDFVLETSACPPRRALATRLCPPLASSSCAYANVHAGDQCLPCWACLVWSTRTR